MNFDIDVVIVACYMIFCLTIGLIKYGKIKNIRDYTLGAKSFPTAILLATTFATAINVRQIIGNVGKIYEMGLVFIIPLLLIPISWFILAKIFAPNLAMFRKNSFLSLSDIMAHWYGNTARWVTNIMSIAFTIGKTATSAMAIGYLLHYFINIPETTGMIIALAVITVYSAFGGIVAVAFTDVFQFLIFFIALPVACIIGYQDAGGFDNIISSLPKTHMQINKSNITLFLSFAFFALLPSTSSIPYIQRVLIAKNKKQFLQTFVGVGILMVPVLVIACIIGLIAHNIDSNIASDQVVYNFIDRYLFPGVKGLMIAGILAIIMSTQDSYLNTTSVLLSHDVCRQIWPNLTDKQELLIARVSCVFISISSIFLILLKQGIMETIWLICNFKEPLLTIPMIAGLIGVRINKKAFTVLLFSSLIAVITTRAITGVFDTRSIAVGMITSVIILYIAHRRNQNKPLLPSKLRITPYLEQLNRAIRISTFSISSMYNIGIIRGVNFMLGTVFLDLTHPNLLNCTFAAMSSLFIILILNEFWHHNLKRYITSIWKVTLICSLLLLPSYIIFSRHFHVCWLFNFILSTILFFILTNSRIAIAFTLVSTAAGYLLNLTIKSNSDLIITDFGLISCGLMIIAIIMQYYAKLCVAKDTHSEVTCQLEAVARQKAQELQDTLNIKNEFLNKLSHEISTPLKGIIGISSNASNAWQKLSEKEQKECISKIAESGNRLLHYTSNIFDFARSKQLKYTLAIESETDLVEIAKTEINNVSQFIILQDKNIAIKLELKLSRPAIVECDPARIGQVLYNLLYNTIKYSEYGEIKVVISSKEQNAQISVCDQGVKIPKKEQARIFDPLFESSREQKDVEQRILAFSKIKEIILLHSGNIVVEDNQPTGVMFKVLLPYIQYKTLVA